MAQRGLFSHGCSSEAHASSLPMACCLKNTDAQSHSHAIVSADASLDHCRSKERVSLLPTKLEPAAEDRACRSAHAAEEAEEERCWVCLEGEEGGPLVQLCACRGTNTWAHKHCVDEWRRTSPREDAAYRCGTCKDHYRDALSLELLGARLQAERANGESTVVTLHTLAQELQAQGKYDEAEPLYRETLEVARATLGNRHPATVKSIRNLGALLQAKGAPPSCQGPYCTVQ